MVDVGANIGMFALAAAEVNGGEGGRQGAACTRELLPGPCRHACGLLAG